MTRTNGDLDATNRRADRKRQRIDAYRIRTGKRRDRRRQLDLIVAGVTKGWLR